MAFIHRETFDILEHIDVESGAEEYFACDEEMSGIIALLNRKGYRTRFCCSGHLYDDLSDTFSVEEGEMTEEEIRENVPGVQAITMRPDGSRKVTLRQCVGLRTYILFEKDTVFPFLPEGFRERGNEISYNYLWDCDLFKEKTISDIQTQPIAFYTYRLKVLNELFSWASALPEVAEI